jgi:hypothetical protein
MIVDLVATMPYFHTADQSVPAERPLRVNHGLAGQGRPTHRNMIGTKKRQRGGWNRTHCVEKQCASEAEGASPQERTKPKLI